MTFILTPSRGKAIKVPTIETGIATNGIIVARQSWIKRNIIAITSNSEAISVQTISSIPALMLDVPSTIVA